MEYFAVNGIGFKSFIKWTLWHCIIILGLTIKEVTLLLWFKGTYLLIIKILTLLRWLICAILHFDVFLLLRGFSPRNNEKTCAAKYMRKDDKESPH